MSATQIEALSNLISSCIQRLCVGPAAVSYIYIAGVESVTLSDASERVTDHGTIVLYADDMVLYRPIYTYKDYWLLHQICHKLSCMIFQATGFFTTTGCYKGHSVIVWHSMH